MAIFYHSLVCIVPLLLLHLSLPAESNQQKDSPCTSRCSIVNICSSRVLTCRKKIKNLNILEEVDCTKTNKVIYVGTSMMSPVFFLDPVLIQTLADEGGETIIFGVAIYKLSRYSFHLVPKQPPLTVVFNSHYIKSFQERAVEMYNINILFYNNTGVIAYKDLKKKIQIKEERHCDSRQAPCLCRYFYNIGNMYLDTISVYLNESSEMICRKLHSVKCSQQSCSIPERTTYYKELNDLRMKKVEIDDYCSTSTTTPILTITLVLSLCTAMQFI